MSGTENTRIYTKEEIENLWKKKGIRKGTLMKIRRGSVVTVMKATRTVDAGEKKGFGFWKIISTKKTDN